MYISTIMPTLSATCLIKSKPKQHTMANNSNKMVTKPLLQHQSRFTVGIVIPQIQQSFPRARLNTTVQIQHLFLHIYELEKCLQNIPVVQKRKKFLTTLPKKNPTTKKTPLPNPCMLTTYYFKGEETGFIFPSFVRTFHYISAEYWFFFPTEQKITQ